jgi:hypothetical protein
MCPRRGRHARREVCEILLTSSKERNGDMMVIQQRWPKRFIADSSIIHRPVLRLATSQRVLEA